MEIAASRSGYSLLNRPSCLYAKVFICKRCVLVSLLLILIITAVAGVSMLISYKIWESRSLPAPPPPGAFVKRAPNDYKLVCYYTFPVASDEGALRPDQINPFLCTHIIAGFGNVVNNTISIDDNQLNVSKALIAMKKSNPQLKVMLSIGGAGNGAGFAAMVRRHLSRKVFIRSALLFVKNYKFDGFDLDWEFPNADAGQRMRFTQLLLEIRREIERQHRHKFLLSVAVAAPPYLVDNSYDVYYMNGAVDFVNLMCYDYHFFTTLTPFTGLNAPLFPEPTQIGYLAMLNINYSANYWVEKGMDRRKIVVGLPTFGHSFTLTNMDNNGLNAPASGYGKLGGNGFFGYTEACEFLAKNHVMPVYDDSAESPYAAFYSEWISFDDARSLLFKTKYIKNGGFGGAMVFSLNTDDFGGACGQETTHFPLIKTIKSTLCGSPWRFSDGIQLQKTKNTGC